MTVKIIVALLLLFMIYNLFKAMMIMLKNEPGQGSMTKFIGRRVMTSAIIILLLVIAVATGIITPNPRPF
ncbi:DUF2909 domain-containing protein [Planctobacterium marinum]|uniref:DUF2909 domain-containing protein n=1 Tax=Planctobacterium marinum TaxID=1631968 RepID=A0AA48HLB1_9ALTE|nr:hypothetical protein MACH26_00780 [Planctobacterium marinum]